MMPHTVSLSGSLSRRELGVAPRGGLDEAPPLDATALSRTYDPDDLGALIEVDQGPPPLETLGLFRGASPAALAEVASAAQHRVLASGEVLFAEGQPTRSVFVVLGGALEIQRHNRESPLARVRALGWTGVFGLLAGRRRATHARALARTELYEIPAAPLLRLINAEPVVRAAVKAHFYDRLAQVFCGSTPLFGSNPVPATLAALSRAFTPAEHPQGHGLVLVEPDAASLYLIGHGRLRLFSPWLRDPLTLGRGQLFGLSCGNVTVEPLTRVSLLGVSPRRCTSPALAELPERARAQGLFIDRSLFVGDAGIPGLS